MQVILLENISKLGQLGDEVRVKRGFARNFLIPKQKAVLATEDNRTYFENNRLALEKKADEVLAKATERQEQFTDLTLDLAVQARDNGVLFGSVTPTLIIDALSKKGLAVEKNEIEFLAPIRELGEYTIKLHFHAKIIVEVGINISAA